MGTRVLIEAKHLNLHLSVSSIDRSHCANTRGTKIHPGISFASRVLSFPAHTTSSRGAYSHGMTMKMTVADAKSAERSESALIARGSPESHSIKGRSGRGLSSRCVHFYGGQGRIGAISTDKALGSVFERRFTSERNSLVKLPGRSFSVGGGGEEGTRTRLTTKKNA